MQELLETLLEEALDNIEQSRDSVPRRFQFPLSQDVIKVAIGMRRVGKTHFLYQTIQQLLEQGVAQQQILMLNFEDDRLLPMNAKQMGELLDAFYTLYPENHERQCYLFLDEVQNVTDWPLVIRRYFDSKRVQLYLTGSSAKLLSKEIATSLRGRSLSVEIWPYDFSEFMIAHKNNVPSGSFGNKTFDIMRQHLLRYFAIGGFPAVQHLVKNEWRETLQGYVDTVILRDIIERHKVENIVLLKYLTTTLLKNAATIFSVGKFYNDVKSQGYKISKETIYTYMSYIEDAFLVFTVPLYSESDRIRQSVSKKIYAIDPGLINANSLDINAIYGKLFENLVYLDLRRQGKEIYYYRTKDNYEIDFLTIDKEGEKELIQVTWEMTDPKTLEREQRALEQAEKELGIKGRILTVKDYLRDFCRKA